MMPPPPPPSDHPDALVPSEPPILPFWDASGTVSWIPGFPEGIEDWTLGDDSDPIEHERRLEVLLHAVEKALGNEKCVSVLSTKCRAEGVNITLEVTFTDGSVVIVRQLRSPSVNSKRPEELELQVESWRAQKFANEVHMLQWLSLNSTIPVPKVLAVVHPSRNGQSNPKIHQNLFIQEKMPGQMLMNVWGLMSDAEKERIVESYADLMLEMFEIDVPQKIGSVCSGDSKTVESPKVGPLLAVSPKRSADRVFTTITEYLDFLFTLKRHSPTIGTTTEDLSRASTVLSSLQTYINEKLLAELTEPALFRCVLVHDDLHSANILVDKQIGKITGIVDWEFHSVQPAVLAARYPAWLSYEGSEDPRFVQDPNNWWEESPEMSVTLCRRYEEFVKERNEAYYEALTRGRALRCAVSWLTDSKMDVGCTGMKGWLDTVYDSRNGQ